MHKKRSAVLTVVFDKSKSMILLVKRRDVPMWVLPGGGVDQGETTECAARREVLEESGLHVNKLSLIAEYTPINKLTQYTTLYSAVADCGILSKSDESSDAAFFRLEEFPVNTFYIHRNWIEESIHSKTLIQRPLNEVTYLNVFKYFVRNPLIFLRYLLSWLGFPVNG